jgi:hypothetical protein
MTTPTMYCPTITYQYSADGGYCSDSLALPFDETIRERFHAYILASYNNPPHCTGERAWERLLELQADLLAKLPDNPFTLRAAWVCGLIDDPPTYVVGLYARLAQARKEAAEEAAQRAASEAKRADLKSKVSCTVVRSYQVAGEDGNDPVAIVRVKSLEDGAELEFACRNIYDFGYVINPRYAITPGRAPGGCMNLDPETKQWFWMDYEAGNGWSRIRDLTPFERLALDYLYEFPPVVDGIRM